MRRMLKAAYLALMLLLCAAVLSGCGGTDLAQTAKDAFRDSTGQLPGPQSALKVYHKQYSDSSLLEKQCTTNGKPTLAELFDIPATRVPASGHIFLFQGALFHLTVLCDLDGKAVAFFDREAVQQRVDAQKADLESRTNALNKRAESGYNVTDADRAPLIALAEDNFALAIRMRGDAALYLVAVMCPVSESADVDDWHMLTEKQIQKIVK